VTSAARAAPECIGVSMKELILISADRGAGEAVLAPLKKRIFTVYQADCLDEGARIQRDQGADLIVVLLPLRDVTGDVVLARLLAQDPRAIIIVCGRDAVIEGAPEALELGAYEYLADTTRRPDALLSAISVALGMRQSDAQLRYLRRKDAEGASWQTMVGRSATMRSVFASVRRICHRTTRHAGPAILITGETGTGKGLLAKAIHYNSVRRSRAFVEINCAAIPPSLIEPELFGHVRGAYTDARSSRAGLIETAQGGTLFLDEISALEAGLQAKLLTTLEERTIRRLGSSDEIQVDLQLIAATNRDLADMVERGLFRPDLFHRLNVLTIELPPLRERREDCVELAESFIRATCLKYGIGEKRLGDDARRLIDEYAWPGNVRELKNQIERIVLLEPGTLITPHQFRLPALGNNMAVSGHGDKLSVQLPDRPFSLDALEREVIRKALRINQGNVSRTARFLGMTRRTLTYRISKHGLA